MPSTSIHRRLSAQSADFFASAPRPEPVEPTRPAEPGWPPVCATCGGPGVFGFGCFFTNGRRTGTWFCQEHKGDAP